MSPAISVCMPVYNGAPFLESAFDCLARQTRRDFEVIVVDDGSSDGSHRLAAQLLESNGLSGRVIRTPNQGCEQARDVCCQNSEAPLIAPYDCDDTWDPEYLESMTTVLESNTELGLVYCDFDEEFTHESRTVRKSHTTPWIDRTRATQSGDVFTFPTGVFFDLLLQGQVLFPPCTLFRRSVYELVGGYASVHPQLRISLDWCFGLRSSRQTSVAYLDKPLVRKTRHGGNVSGNALRTAISDVTVLERILADTTLTPAQRRHARCRASRRASDAAYQEWSVKQDPGRARQWLLKSLHYDWHKGSAVMLLKTFVPLAIVRKLRG